MFVMNDEYKALLTDFNDALTKQLLVMRQRTIQMRDAILQTNIDGDSMEAIGKCFFGYAYPKNHPVQTYRAKAMWCVLNGTWDNYIPLYSDGVDGGFRLYGDEGPPSEIKFQYYEEGLNNWNEGLDSEMTKDMHLTRVFHNLYDHTWNSGHLQTQGFAGAPFKLAYSDKSPYLCTAKMENGLLSFLIAQIALFMAFVSVICGAPCQSTNNHGLQYLRKQSALIITTSLSLLHILDLTQQIGGGTMNLLHTRADAIRNKK